MGKDYWYWPTFSSSSSSSSSKASATSGCMSALFQTFDFHPFHFSTNQQQHKSPSSSSSSSSSTISISQYLSKGAAAAPQEPTTNTFQSHHATSSSKQQHLQIPKNIIRIKTSRSILTRTRSGNYSSDDFSSEMSFSPGTKTPTLVARLMGLDLLPDNNNNNNNSSSSSSSSTLSTPILNTNNNNNPQLHHNPKARQRHHHQIMRHRHSTDSIGTIPRSLSEAPRRSDVEHSRLSLQINKENIIGVDDDTYLETPRFSFSKRKFDENNNSNSSSRSPSQYARQIVKQVKESVSRRVGITDITNTIKNRDQESVGPQIRFKKATSSNNESCSPGKQSPRIGRFIDTKHSNNNNNNNNKQSNSITKPSPSPSPLKSKDQKPLPSSPTTTTPLPPVAKIETQLSSKIDDLQSKKSSSSVPKSKRSRTTTTNTEKLGSGVSRATPPQTSSIRKKQQESFIACALSPTRPKAKNRSTHPLSSNLLLNTAPNLLPLKTHPSPLPTKILQKQACDTEEQKLSIAQLSSCACQKYKKPATAATTTTGTGTDDEGPEFQYIKSILSRIGLGKATLPHIQYQWFSLSHPLDPSLFHYLEIHHYPSSNSDNWRDQLGPRCNRRLLFDLVDELLSEILGRPKQAHGLLVERVWRKVRRLLPGAKCEFLEDIDGLIEMEEMERKVKEEREEGLVMEIGRSILETLVHETVTGFVNGFV
ncbi:hypothetical protein PIB30_011384 [Stylosanthes scabra]|uniref:DUF4378 domain-containing protein n=1 Tax=Stylosanthes scabra TaxID=79078 RepID=A0ABU6Y688_9FABA|nr:hypothetical protein [Stylosanthes scabra]